MTPIRSDDLGPDFADVSKLICTASAIQNFSSENQSGSLSERFTDTSTS